MTDRLQLAAYIAAMLQHEPNGMALAAIARQLGVRPSSVRAVLRADPWFARTGSTSGARWHLVAPDGTGRNGTEREQPDVLAELADLSRRVAALEATVEALAGRNGARAAS